MKVNLQVKKDILLTVKQQRYIEKRLAKLNRFIKDKTQAVFADIKLSDETGVAKGGVDKLVNITVQVPGEQAPIHITEREDKIMRAFNLAVDKVERRMREEHRRLVGQNRRGGRLDKIIGILRRRRRS